MLQPNQHTAPDLTPNTGQGSDAELISQTLTWLGDHGHDIAPEVFGRYLTHHPESVSLFRVVDPTQPPHGCGQMVFEMLSVLQDCAEGKPYVDGYLRDLVHGHKGFGVRGQQVYADVLQVLADIVHDRLAGHGSASQAAAWARQTQALLDRIRTAVHAFDPQ